MIEKIDLSLMKFASDGEEEQAIIDLESGLKSPFWQFMQRILDQNIEQIRTELEEKQGMTGEQNDYLKQRLQDLKKLRSIPETQLAALRPAKEEPEIDEDDPYEQNTSKRE